MEIRFYKCTDTRNTIGKGLSDYVSTFVNLKYQDFSVTNPTLLLKFSEYPTYNYIYIPAIKRYYFIEDIVVKTDKTFELKLKVDVLESFKDDILNGYGKMVKSDTGESYYNDGYEHLETFEKHEFNSSVTLEDKKFVVLATLGGV